MFQSGGQYIGNLQAANGGVGGGLARMTQMPIYPTMFFWHYPRDVNFANDSIYFKTPSYS